VSSPYGKVLRSLYCMSQCCEVQPSLFRNSVLRCVKSWQTLRRTMILGGKRKSRICSGNTCYHSVQNVACTEL